MCLFSFHFFSRTLCTAVPVSLIIIPPCSSGNKVVFEPAQSDTVFIRRHMSHLYEGKGTRQSKQASSPPVWKSFDKFTLWKLRAHVLYKTILSEQCLQYTKKSSRKRLQPLGKKNIYMQSLHLLFMLNLLIQQPNYIPLSFSLPIASHVLCLLCSKMRCGRTLLRKQKWAQKCGMIGAA